MHHKIATSQKMGVSTFSLHTCILCTVSAAAEQSASRPQNSFVVEL